MAHCTCNAKDRAELRKKILRVLEPESGGPRKRSVLIGLAGGDEKLRPVLDELVEDGLVERRTCHGGQRYALTRRGA